MNSTKLLYMEDMSSLVCDAFIESVNNESGKYVVYLDQTVFYPQGGGQPYDTGKILSPDSCFIVEEVRFVEGQVLHMGHFDGQPLLQGEDVKCHVDKERRTLNTRLHSAGHIVDMAVSNLGYDWVPAKGYHFPQGAYIEYKVKAVPENKEKLKVDIENEIEKILVANPKTKLKLVNIDEMKKLCRNVPEFIPKDKPSRVVLYGDFGVPCGGTHVAQLKDVGKITIRKIKTAGDNLRVSYEIS